MGRKNPLANIRVSEKNEPHKSRDNVVTSLNIDNLPNLNITSREKNTTITIQALKKPASIVLDFDKKVDYLKLSNREKKVKSTSLGYISIISLCQMMRTHCSEYL